jgi:hypothetical protein
LVAEKRPLGPDPVLRWSHAGLGCEGTGLMGRLSACVLAVATLLFGAWAAPAPAVSVTVTGPEETVYDWDTMRCHDLDLPDGPLRAFRDALGRSQLVVASGWGNTRMIGPNLDNVTKNCTIILGNQHLPMPSDYSDWDWVQGIYTFDGQEIFALLHDEYHGSEHPGFCGDAFIKCRYNSITFARSTDGGNSFVRPPPPTNLVAAIPYRYVPGDGRYGYFAPSNVIEKDGYYYNFILASAEYKEQSPGVCLMRTQTLGDARSWRAWDGEGFNVRFVDPYRESVEPLGSHVCEPVDPDLADLNRNVSYASNIGKYVAVGKTRAFVPSLGITTPGIFYSLSDDLIHWSGRELLMVAEDGNTWQCGDPEPVTYPALIDTDSPERNFESTDGTTYMYLTKFLHENCISVLKRDLVRYSIQISP